MYTSRHRHLQVDVDIYICRYTYTQADVDLKKRNNNNTVFLFISIRRRVSLSFKNNVLRVLECHLIKSTLRCLARKKTTRHLTLHASFENDLGLPTIRLSLVQRSYCNIRQTR